LVGYTSVEMTSSPTPITAPLQDGPSRELLLSTPFLLKRLGMAVKERSLQAFGPTGLNPQHHAVLSLLDEGARETQATIADALGYDRGHLVGLLDELEAKGYVERRRDPGDRRRHLVSLTPAGAQALGELRAIAKRVEKEFLAPLDADERRALHALLLELARYHDPRCAGARRTSVSRSATSP
jgi:DNA-binding MarR family transcriptional regulator